MLRRNRFIAIAAVMLLSAVAAAQEANPEKVYGDFNRFCIRHFGAEKEPLVYEKFGKELKILPHGSWRHVSENSACIAFETNLPAKAYVEYGETARYGKKTPDPERHFYLHVHYLKDLKPDATYHYRLVAVDERGNRIPSEDTTFETRKIPNAVYVPGDMDGAPYVLDRPKATYVVKKDIIARNQGVRVAASGVVLDLNGHTLVYDEAEPVPYEGRFKGYGKYVYSDAATFGVRVFGKLKDVKVLNGIIRQGKNNGGGARGYGFNPVFTKYTTQTEIAGITAEYSGADITGIFACNDQNASVHHNVVIDRGTELRDRHWGLSGIHLTKSNIVHHNLVKRARHCGVKPGAGSQVYSNEIHVDSWATNSCALSSSYDGRTYSNKCFGTGYHPQGIHIGYRNAKNVKSFDNFVHIRAVSPCPRWKEYGPTSSVRGVRLKLGPFENIEFYNNTVVVTGSGGSWLRGIITTPRAGPDSVKNVVIRDNVVKVIAEDAETDRAYALAACGPDASDPVSGDRATNPIIWKNNTLISNTCHIRFGDKYSCGWRHHMYGTRFIRAGNDPRYRMIGCGYWRSDSFGHKLIDSVFEGEGVGYDSVVFDGTGRREFSVGWTLTVKTTPGADVTITDKTGKQVFSGVADAQGAARAALVEYTRNAQGKTLLTPHSVSVETNGRKAEKTLTMARTREMTLLPR